MRADWPSLVLALSLSQCAKDDAPSVSASAPAPVASEAAGAPPARPPVPALVSLSGAYQPPPPASAGASDAPLLYSRVAKTWIYERPSRKSAKLGYLRAGGSVRTSREAAGREDCAQGWYPVEPEGYVCLGPEATLDPSDPVVRAIAGLGANPSRKLPFIYGTVRRPGPIYARLPTRSELETAEPDIDERMQQWLGAEGEIGASYAQEVWLGAPGTPPDPRAAWQEKTSSPLPALLENSGSVPTISSKRDPGSLVIERMRPRVGFAFLQTFLHEGRRYGLTVDLEILPTDRLRPIRGSDFHGYEIDKDVRFPFAIVRSDEARFWLWQKSSGRLMDAGAAAYRSAVQLSGKQQFFRGRLHYETADGKWLSDRDASRLDPARRMPAWGKNGEKWIDVNLTKQTLVLYAGTKPVYATLISSGEAGLEDPEHTTATKRGIFRIHTKHLSATMSSSEVGEEFELREVPYVQYFDREGYAMHGVYWHDRFGVPKSHGCINLAPEDARRIFYFTEPSVPSGWHGALLPLRGTVLFVHP
jgi:hypothetical protein